MVLEFSLTESPTLKYRAVNNLISDSFVRRRQKKEKEKSVTGIRH